MTALTDLIEMTDVKIPAQCRECVKVETCAFLRCLKEKDCKQREVRYTIDSLMAGIDEIRY